MKKSRKYGLIAGGVAAIVVTGALVYFGYNTGHMPTLPTPPGVVVPPGMRYVGGDEFDALDGSPPDAAKWSVTADSYYMSRSAHPTSDPLRRNEAVIRSGSLFLLPGGAQPARSVVIEPTHELPTRRAGAVEIRARIIMPFGSVKSLDQTLPYGAEHGATLRVLSESGGDVVLKGFWYKSLSEIESGDITITRMAHEQLQAEGVFHAYRMEWSSSGVRFLCDGVIVEPPEIDKEFLKAPRFPDAVLRHLDFLPERLYQNLSDATSDVFSAEKHRLEISAYADAYGTLEKRAGLEIDYVRIFQE